MLQTFQCFNCCGLRKESVRYEEICPNCGSAMTLPSWNLYDLLIESEIPAYTDCTQAEFVSIGSLLSDEPRLLSYAMSERFVAQAVEKRNLSVLFVRPEDTPVGLPVHVTAVYSEQPRVDFFLFHNWLIENTEFYGDLINNDHCPHHNTRLGKDVTISLDVTAISNAVIESGATIAPGAVIGVDGARLIRKPDGTFFRALHGGSVYIGEGAHIGANAVVVRSMWRRPTTIGAGAFVGNLVNVGHNVQIEPGAIVLPGVMLCGRSEIGGTGTMSVGSMTAPGVRVDGTASLGAVVTKDVSPSSEVSGNFAIRHAKRVKHIKKLEKRRMSTMLKKLFLLIALVVLLVGCDSALPDQETQERIPTIISVEKEAECQNPEKPFLISVYISSNEGYHHLRCDYYTTSGNSDLSTGGEVVLFGCGYFESEKFDASLIEFIYALRCDDGQNWEIDKVIYEQ